MNGASDLELRELLDALVNAGRDFVVDEDAGEAADLQQVAAFRQLKSREREALYLKGLGYSYREIARLTDSTYTAVNRRITEGRAALRRIHHGSVG